MKSNSMQETIFILTEGFATQHGSTSETIQQAVALWLTKEIRRIIN